MDQIVNLVKNGKVQEGSTITTKGMIRVDKNDGSVYVESMHDLVLIDGFNLTDLIAGVEAPARVDSSSESYQDLLNKYEEEKQLGNQSANQIQQLKEELIAIKRNNAEVVSNHQRDINQLNMDKNIEYLDLELQLQASQSKLASALKELELERNQHSADADRLKAVVHVEEMMDKDRLLKDQLHSDEISRLCSELKKAQTELEAAKADPTKTKNKLKRLLSFRKENSTTSLPSSGSPDM